MKKPPLGLRPKSIHLHLRKKDILMAMARYIQADKIIPQEWIDEFIELNQAQPEDSTDERCFDCGVCLGETHHSYCAAKGTIFNG